MLEELLGQLLWGEAHGIDVVGPHGKRLCGRLHDLQRGPQAVINIHHGQPCAGFQVALELAVLGGIMENLHSIVWKRTLVSVGFPRVVSEPFRWSQWFPCVFNSKPL